MSDQTFKLPEVTEEDRAIGFMFWPVISSDGREKLMRVFRPNPAFMAEVFKLGTSNAQFYGCIAHALRIDVSMALNLSPVSAVEVFLLCHRLASESFFVLALNAAKELGRGIIKESAPGTSAGLNLILHTSPEKPNKPTDN